MQRPTRPELWPTNGGRREREMGCGLVSDDEGPIGSMGRWAVEFKKGFDLRDRAHLSSFGASELDVAARGGGGL